MGMKPLGKSERRGLIPLILAVALITGVGFMMKRSDAVPAEQAPVTVYRTVTDTVYRARRSSAHKKKRRGNKATHRSRIKSSATVPPRDFLADTIPESKSMPESVN